MPSFKNFQTSPTWSLRQFVLLIRFVVHEDEHILLAVEELGCKLHDVGRFEYLAGPVRAIYNGATDEVLEFAFVQRVAFARLAEVHLHHQVRHTIDLYFEAFAKVTGSCTWSRLVFLVVDWYVAEVVTVSY